MNHHVSFKATLDKEMWVPDAVEVLYTKLSEDTLLRAMLEESLIAAHSHARRQLSPILFEALFWPESWQDYVNYAWEFSRWVPHQSTNPAWTEPGTDEQQEVYDHLCHFYYLIDQPVGPEEKRVQNDPWFSRWLIDYSNDWGAFLNTTESFNDVALKSFLEDSPQYRVQDSMIDGRPNNPSGWLTFNQFFARELNPGLRPVSSPSDNTVIVSPADCTFRAQYNISASSTVPEIRVKLTHKYASIQDLLDGSPYGDCFANGKMVHYFLGPYSYHRFHTPVAGLLKECRAVQGLNYLQVNIDDGQFDAPDNSEGGYEFNQARGIVILDTSQSPCGDIGLVAVIPVGMAQVSSVNMTAQTGNILEKGDEFGYFLFGGSDIIVLFQEGVDPEIFDGGQYRHYGTPIAKCFD
ncbi:phosphatidylserine decarboxylase [Vibrio quintilis]|uniref:Phosphatidylserine decarboxylase proenzyme n=1 Tax=Vibrio quintilis TaxID=1117707 RepID=A0A1M7YXG7_9VIBR|nr:phosphatidylserine decarboxylase [Vibrio quintilis]SHO57308.1 Phosphatidylserine decarboxylase proenzyme [Vibrio quintilis]